MADGTDFHTQQMYWLQWVSNLSEVLKRARFGELTSDWRHALTEAFPLGPLASRAMKDSSVTALLDIVTGPPRAWEPGVPRRGWEDALECWYYDSIRVANSVLERSFRAALRAAESANQARERHYLIHIAGGVPVPEPREFSETDHCDQLVGSEVYRWELLRRYQVAVATAEYRAGMVAGGVELQSDWLGWLQAELHNLPSMAALKDGPDLGQVRATIETAHQPGYRAQLEILPDYWLGQGRADGDPAGLSA